MMYKYEEQVIGDLAKVKGGKRLPKGKNLISIPNSHPYIRIRDLGKSKILELTDDYEFVDDATQSTISKYVVEKDDIVISIVGTIGLVGVVGATLHDANLTENCVKLTNISEHVDRGYLYYYLISPMGQVEISKGTVGAVQPKLPIKNIQNIKIVLPPLDVQKKVASILSAIDDKIRVNEAINHNLEAQASELFDAWFISFVRSDGKMPADWHKGTLGDIAAITSGKRPPMKQAVASVDATIPLVGAASIMGFTNAILYNEPILVTGRVGTHGVVQRFQSPCWTSDNTLVIKSDFYEYTFQVLQRVDYVNMNRGSTQPLITQTDLKNVSIVIPTEEVLLEYEKIAGSLMAMYESNRKENERLATLRDTLLPKLMSGEIDVSEVEI